MDEARAVLARLERIETLERGHADAAALLLELRELASEAVAWAEREADPTARRAAEALVTAVGGGLTRSSRVAVTVPDRLMAPTE